MLIFFSIVCTFKPDNYHDSIFGLFFLFNTFTSAMKSETDFIPGIIVIKAL